MRSRDDLATAISAESSNDGDDDARGKSAAVAAVATTAKLHRDHDADGGNNVDGRDDVKHVDEHADEFHLPTDEDDDSRFTLRDGAIDNVMTMTQTMNGDNHFPQKQRTK